MSGSDLSDFLEITDGRARGTDTHGALLSVKKIDLTIMREAIGCLDGVSLSFMVRQREEGGKKS